MICVGIMCQASVWRLQRGYGVAATSQPASCRALSILAVETGEDYSLGLFAGACRGVGALSLGGSLLTCLFSRLGHVTAIPTHTTIVGTLSVTRSRGRERQQEADVEREYSIAINKHHAYTQTDIGTRHACLCLSWGAQIITPRSHTCMSKRPRKISGPKLMPRKYPSDTDYGCYTRVWLWLTHKGVARRQVARLRCPSRLGSNLTCPRRQGTRLRCPRPTRDALWCEPLHTLNPQPSTLNHTITIICG